MRPNNWFLTRRRCVFAPLVLLLILPHAGAQEKTVPVALLPPLPIITLQKAVAVGGVARGGRIPFAEDAIQNLRVQGKWQPPIAGDIAATLPDGSSRRWETLEADKDGWFTGRALAGGYLYATVESPEERICLLEATGNTSVSVNGETRAGDPYSYGYLRLPVRLRRGTNQLLFSVARGRLRARFLPVSTPLAWNTDDSTLPDLRTGRKDILWAAVPLMNASDRTLTGLKVQTIVTGGKTLETTLPPLPPMTVRKVGFRLQPPDNLTGEKTSLQVRLIAPDKRAAPMETTVSLRVRQPEQTYKQTFQSAIDGTVQYFAVYPARKPAPANALVLSLHGASVEAIGQADAYSSKDWATLVAPTNRRPYGFDWEDWGRLDALEVLAQAQSQFPHDPDRVFLTGHSMGGHGTWSIGSLFSDRFAVIGPSAGWISFATYGGGRRRGGGENAPQVDAVTALVQRAANQHDTLAWSANLLQERIYIIHGDADDNVPVTEARRMREQLAALHHPQVEWHEEKGAGHWWDDDKTPGAECVDWRPLFARFASERLRPETWDAVNFTTVNPAISGANRWVRVEQQEKALLPSVVQLTWKQSEGAITGTTRNIATLTIRANQLPGNGSVRSLLLDSQKIESGEMRGDITLRRVAGKWQDSGKISPGEKSPERGGPFKQAFQNRFVLVYGTMGTAEENRASYARARLDAEAFLYRGNGSPALIADRDYDTQAMRDQSVILYGNADTNRLWGSLLKNSPIQVMRGKVLVGDKETVGENLACLFLQPKPGSSKASVGVVGASGSEGMLLTERFPYFTSGAAFPDWVVVDSGVLTDAKRGVVAAGYFGNDWKLSSGESAWRTP